MVLTRSSRKRDVAEGGGVSADVLGANEGNNNNNNIAVVVVDNEPSALQPKAKRQRTAASSSTATNAAQNKKARALKPVAANSNSNSNSNNVATTIDKATKPAAAAAKATTKPKPAAAAKVNNKKTKQHSQSKTKVKEEQVEPEATTSTSTATASSSTATRADDDVKAEAADATTDTDANNAVTKSSSTTSLNTANHFISSNTSSYQNGTPDDIDARHADDPLYVTDYVQDMYEHFRSKEEITSIDCMYMGSAANGKQPNINESMRCILVDWLIEVHYKFKLFPETLYLTVNILDRFLAQTIDAVTKRDLQLVGVTALLISAKYEEMYVPELRDLTYICDGAYTEAKILQMEENILKTLNYSVTVPTPHTFLIRFLKAAHADKLMAQLACFLLDGTLLSLENLTCLWRPSQLAAAAILLARRQLGRHNWSPTLVAYSLYREEDVLPVARSLLKNKHHLDKNRELLALAKKYSKTKYGKVSHITFAPLLEYADEEEEGSGDDSIADSV